MGCLDRIQGRARVLGHGLHEKSVSKFPLGALGVGPVRGRFREQRASGTTRTGPTPSRRGPLPSWFHLVQVAKHGQIPFRIGFRLAKVNPTDPLMAVKDFVEPIRLTRQQPHRPTDERLPNPNRVAPETDRRYSRLELRRTSASTAVLHAGKNLGIATLAQAISAGRNLHSDRPCGSLSIADLSPGIKVSADTPKDPSGLTRNTSAFVKGAMETLVLPFESADVMRADVRHANPPVEQAMMSQSSTIARHSRPTASHCPSTFEPVTRIDETSSPVHPPPCRPAHCRRKRAPRSSNANDRPEPPLGWAQRPLTDHREMAFEIHLP